MARTLNGVDTESEIRRVEAHLRESGWAEHASLEREMFSWTSLANEVIACVMAFGTYTNDLCSRDYLGSVVERDRSPARCDQCEGRSGRRALPLVDG